jgi:hypothetical protein
MNQQIKTIEHPLKMENEKTGTQPSMMEIERLVEHIH